MSLIQDIENRLLDALKRLFAPVIGPLTKLWNTLSGMFDAIFNLIPETRDLITSTVEEIQGWRDFRQNIHFKNGVINLKSARQKLTDLLDEAIDAYHALVDLFTQGFKDTVAKPFEDAHEAALELADLLESFGSIGLRDFIEKFGAKIKKAGGKILEVLAIIEAVAEALLRVVRELQTIVDLSKDLRETVETGEGLFLQQHNPRRTVEVVDGKSLKIRVGKLHS
jgi:hypothetical protein